MKNLIKLLIITLTIFLFTCCEKKSYIDLDKESYYQFDINDTLVYKGDITSDTFMVYNIYKETYSIDKRIYIERLTVELHELTKDCTDSTYDYCLAAIFRDANQGTQLYFRNDRSDYRFVEEAPITDYNIGQYSFSEVYKIDYQLLNEPTKKDVRTVYYTHKYGIIAYELLSGEIVELDEKYFE